MGTLTSSTDWTGREINGVVLGEPSRAAVDANGDPTGDYVWDHPAIPGDIIDSEGDIWMEVDENAPWQVGPV